MTLGTIFHQISLKLNIFSVVLIGWVALLLGLDPDLRESWLQVSIFGLGSGLLSILSLHLMGYFSHFRVLPWFGDLPAIAGSVLISALAQFTAMRAFGPMSFAHQKIYLFALPIAGTLFLSHYLHELFFLRNGRHWRRIVLMVLPSEEAELREVFRALGMERFLELIGGAEVKKAFLNRRERRIDQIIISRGTVRDFRNNSYLIRAHLEGIPIIDRRELLADLTGRIRIDDSDLWSFFMTATSQTPLLTAYSQFKVVAEPVIAVLLAVLLAPVMAAVALMVAATSNGPVIFRQRRLGYLGKRFDLVKFRTMIVESEVNGPQWSSGHDNRITPVGRFLRKTRLDELPQLWNVMRGEMSFFGPRPERPEFYRKLRADVPLFSIRTSIRPGVTGWAQVCAGYAASVEESRIKLEHDLYYIKHVSPRLDLIILASTFLVAIGYEKKSKALSKDSPDQVKVGGASA